MLYKFPTLLACFVALGRGFVRVSADGQYYNNEIADILFVIDLVPQAEHPEEDASKMLRFDGLSTTLSELSKKLPINDTRMRFAIVKGVKDQDVVVMTKFSQGIKPEDMRFSSDKLLAASPHDLKKLISDADAKTSSPSDGRREPAPRVVIYFGIYPSVSMDEVHWREGAQKVGDQTKETDITIWFVSMGFGNNETALEGNRYEKFGTLGAMGIRASNYVSSKMLTLLPQKCFGQTVIDSVCYYNDSKKNCIYKRSFAPPTSPEDKSLCLNGALKWPCPGGKTKCEEWCTNSAMQKWTECDCRTATANNTLQRPPGEFYEHCDYRATTHCTPVGCTSPPTTPTYVLVMPIWAVFLVTFCVVVITVVICTLCIYLTWFPVGRDEILSRRGFSGPAGRYRRPHERVADTMRSVMEAFARRRGGTRLADSQWSRKMDPSKMGMQRGRESRTPQGREPRMPQGRGPGMPQGREPGMPQGQPSKVGPSGTSPHLHYYSPRSSR